MLMKKHIIIAMISVLTLAVAAPAFAANVNGSLDFGYNMFDMGAIDPTADAGLSITGNVNENVSAGIGLNTDNVASWSPYITEAWIQAQNTPVGTVKLGAFDMNFGEGNDTAWILAPEYTLNAMVSNQIVGANVAGGVAFDKTGNLAAAGASVNVKPVEDLDATVGVLAYDASSWQPAFGYNVSYTGIENMGLGLRGNLQSEEMIASAAYQLMPEVKLSGEYGKEAYSGNIILNAGIDGTFGNMTAGAHYAGINGAGEVSVNGGYNFELTKGLTVGLAGDYNITTDDSNLSASAGVSF